MLRLINTAAVYGGLGLAGGLYYRTLTHSRHFVGDTQLSLVHTHFLALGMLTFLVLASLERGVQFLSARGGRLVEPLWHAGLLLTAGTMLVKGSLQVLGQSYPEAMLAGIAGLGHMLLTLAVIALFVALNSAVRRTRRLAGADEVAR